MKNLFALLIALLFSLLNHAHGQDAIATIPDLVLPAGNIEVPLEVDFTLDDVCSFQFYIHFDDARLTFKGIDDPQLLPGIAPSPPGSPSPILITWFSASFQPADFAGKLLDILFEYDGGGLSPIGFLLTFPEDCAIYDCVLFNEYGSVEYNDGSVRPLPSVPLSRWAVFLGLGLIVAFTIIKRSRLI